jgi:hypothetical protein
MWPIGNVKPFKPATHPVRISLGVPSLERSTRELERFAKKEGIEHRPGTQRSREQIATRIKAGIARNVWGDDGYYRILLEKDPASRHGTSWLQGAPHPSLIRVPAEPFLMVPDRRVPTAYAADRKGHVALPHKTGGANEKGALRPLSRSISVNGLVSSSVLGSVDSRFSSSSSRVSSSSSSGSSLSGSSFSFSSSLVHHFLSGVCSLVGFVLHVLLGAASASNEETPPWWRAVRTS